MPMNVITKILSTRILNTFDISLVSHILMITLFQRYDYVHRVVPFSFILNKKKSCDIE